MLGKLLPKQTELVVGGHTLKFNSVEEFEFCMNGRTSVPSKKITDMVKFSAKDLKREAQTIKGIEKTFVSILSKSIEDPASINRGLRELDPSLFSQDHSWREIISALNEGGDNLNPLRRVALVKYMQYLASRQEIIKYLYTEKQHSITDTAKNENDDEIDTLKETLILDGTVLESAKSSGKENMERLPKGEVINLVLTPGTEVDISLSKHKCKICMNDAIYFIDQAGNKHEINKGRNVIGRDSVSDIRIDSSLRDISRFHLVIENTGDNCLLITDMSSHGTYLPEKYLSVHNAA